ncbi:MAG: tRNA preQ1(34) S-adenosylmethionine ribosyltransferase-isomerase QueA [Pseudomonadota bacterium]
MLLSDFDYTYPKELVAQQPLPVRDASRMMVVDRAKGSWKHSCVASLPDFLHEGDLVVFNNSKVVPARLFGKRGTGEDIELLVVEPAPEAKDVWRCLLKRAKRIRTGENLFFGMQSKATAKGHDGIYLLVEFKGDSLKLATEHHGVPPLPPYIDRKGYDAYTDEDRERYQTIYAQSPGSAAAPTAGLHFSDDLIQAIKTKGAKLESVTLHVGIDTFAPVRTEKIKEHKIHGERIEISESTARQVMRAKEEGRRVIAIGTTTMRALESATREDNSLQHGTWTTDLYITPGYNFKIVDAMLTNFHQPKSTLLMMISAFAGREFILSCYDEAIRERYRLFSYGDCMLIL